MTPNALPAVAPAAAVTSSCVADADTVIVALVPVIEPVTVSVAVIVRLPASVRVTPFVNVWTPLSPPVKV